MITGPGKGKTTAAFGQALRMVGHGGRVLVIQFLKGRASGEVLAAKEIQGFTVLQFGDQLFIDLQNPKPEDREMVRKGWEAAWQAAAGHDYEMIVLDEINVALAYGLISVDEFREMLKSRASGVHLVLTGRSAPPEIIDLADIVSEIHEVRHHYRQGFPAIKGIEY